MQTHAAAAHGISRGSENASSSRHRQQHPIVAGRKASSLVLTVVAIAIGIAITAAFGQVALAIYSFSLLVPLYLLWMSADVLRADEEPRDRE
jgi:hypothetical protein